MKVGRNAGPLLGVLLALAASPAFADPDVVRGRYLPSTSPMPFSLTRVEDGWSGAVALTPGAPPWRLTLRRAGSGHQLIVDQTVRASVGLAGVLEERTPDGEWTWARRTVTLSRQGERLVGNGFELRLPEEAPTPHDTGWFTDADALPVPREARRELDRALSTRDPDDVRSLGVVDTNLATGEERARLIEAISATPGDAEAAWVARLLRHGLPTGSPLTIVREPPGTGAETVEALRRRGTLRDVVDAFDDPSVHEALVANVGSADAARALAASLATRDTDERRLAVHHVFDRARALGALDEVLEGARALPNETLRDLVDQARPTRRPHVIAHRADPVRFPENTRPAIESALDVGADGVEIDVCLTRDDRIVLWHDATQDGLVAGVRNLGWEPGMGYRPTLPDVTSSLRRPIHQLALRDVQAHFGYDARDDRLRPGSEFEIPALDDVADLLTGFRRVVLDTKIPADVPGLRPRFARALRRVLAAHPALAPRLVVMTPEGDLLRDLKRLLGDRLLYTHDIEITSLVPGSHSAVSAALAMGNRVASIGRPRTPMLGGEYSYYLRVLKEDRARIEREGLDLKLVAWTLNDELELREVIAVGVDGIVTDRPELLQAVLRAMGL